MKETRYLTDEDREWLKQNYPHHTNRACLQHLKIGYAKLKEWVAECGLKYRNQTHNNTREKLKNQWKEEIKCGDYCIDCPNYVNGGTCFKDGKIIGALWQKPCFKN